MQRDSDLWYRHERTSGHGGSFEPSTVTDAVSDLLEKIDRNPGFDWKRSWATTDPETGEPLTRGDVPEAPVSGDARHWLAWAASLKQDGQRSERPIAQQQPKADALGRPVVPPTDEEHARAQRIANERRQQIINEVSDAVGYNPGRERETFVRLHRENPGTASSVLRDLHKRYYDELNKRIGSRDLYAEALREVVEGRLDPYRPDERFVRAFISDQQRRKVEEDAARLATAAGNVAGPLAEYYPILSYGFSLGLGGLIGRAANEALQRIPTPTAEDVTKAQETMAARNVAYELAPQLVDDSPTVRARAAREAVRLLREEHMPILRMAIAEMAHSKYIGESEGDRPGLAERVRASFEQGIMDVGRTLADWSSTARQRELEQYAGEAVDPTRDRGIVATGMIDAARMLPPMLASAPFMAGKVAMTGSKALANLFWTKMVASEEYARMVNEGVNPMFAAPASVVSGYVQALIESMAPVPLLKNGELISLAALKRGIRRDLFKGAFKDIFTEAVAEEGLQGVVSAITNTVGNVLQAFYDGTSLSENMAKVGLPSDWIRAGAQDALRAIVPVMFMVGPRLPAQLAQRQEQIDLARATNAAQAAAQEIAAAHTATATRKQIASGRVWGSGRILDLDPAGAAEFARIMARAQLPTDPAQYGGSMTADGAVTGISLEAVRRLAESAPLHVDETINSILEQGFSRAAIPMRSRMEREIFGHALLWDLMPETYRRLAETGELESRVETMTGVLPDESGQGYRPVEALVPRGALRRGQPQRTEPDGAAPELGGELMPTPPRGTREAVTRTPLSAPRTLAPDDDLRARMWPSLYLPRADETQPEIRRPADDPRDVLQRIAARPHEQRVQDAAREVKDAYARSVGAPRGERLAAQQRATAEAALRHGVSEYEVRRALGWNVRDVQAIDLSQQPTLPDIIKADYEPPQQPEKPKEEPPAGDEPEPPPPPAPLPGEQVYSDEPPNELVAPPPPGAERFGRQVVYNKSLGYVRDRERNPYRIRFVWLPTSKLAASHIPATASGEVFAFRPNPEHDRALQNRKPEGKKSAQAIVTDMIAKPDWPIFIESSPTATEGPPVVWYRPETRKYLGTAGNHRLMAMLEWPEDKYKQYLQQVRETYGIEPPPELAGQRPIFVRHLLGTYEEARRLAPLSQQSTAQAETPWERAIGLLNESAINYEDVPAPYIKSIVTKDNVGEFVKNRRNDRYMEWLTGRMSPAARNELFDNPDLLAQRINTGFIALLPPAARDVAEMADANQQEMFIAMAPTVALIHQLAESGRIAKAYDAYDAVEDAAMIWQSSADSAKSYEKFIKHLDIILATDPLPGAETFTFHGSMQGLAMAALLRKASNARNAAQTIHETLTTILDAAMADDPNQLTFAGMESDHDSNAALIYMQAAFGQVRGRQLFLSLIHI